VFISESYAYGALQQNRNLYLYLLLAIDLALLIAYPLCSLGFLPDKQLLVGENLSYGEWFQFFKFSGLIIGLFCLAYSRHSRVLFSWALIFSLLLIDDFFELHEAGGNWLTTKINSLELLPVYFSKSYGELLVLGVGGLVLVTPILLCHWRGSEDEPNLIISQDILLLMLALAFFAAGVDFVHEFFERRTLMRGLFTLLEEGGEMIVLSSTVWYISWVVKQRFASKNEALIFN
jgi:hypothetical protein